VFSTNANLGYYFDSVMDANRDGKLSPSEMIENSCMREEDVRCIKDMKQVMDVFNKVDVERKGYITKEQYLGFFKREKIGTPIEGGPQQLHLAVTGNPTEMVVTWISRDKDEPSIVQYGLTSQNLDTNATGTIFTYTAGIDGWSGWIHRVTLVELKTATTYYYRVGMPDSWSDVFTFVTAPNPSDSAFGKQVIALVADQGTYPASWEVIDLMIASHAQEAFNLVLHAGDVCYAGVSSEWELEEIWDVWEDWVEPIAANVPYMFAVGNHEKYYNFAAYNNRFLMPGAQSGGNGNFWHSFDYGLIHFLCFSTEHNYAPGSEQYNWIVQDLIKANQNRHLRPWLIVSAHRPLYCTDTDEWNSHCPGAPLPAIIEPLFLQYKVDLYVAGHQHVYERIHPNINGTVVSTGNFYTNPKAPAYIVQATAGVFMDDSWIDPQPSWSASRQSGTGFGKLTLNQTHMHYQFILEETSQQGDYFWIIKA